MYTQENLQEWQWWIMKRMQESSVLSCAERELLETCRDAVREVVPGAVLILYGSRARGDAGWDSDYDLLILVVLGHKNEIYTLPDEERRRWREAVKGLDAKWAAELEAKGLPGQALLQEARALSVKYGEAE
jgi:predicted nucleotidyltransferase